MQNTNRKRLYIFITRKSISYNFYKKKFHKQGCFVNLLQKNFAVYCHHKANVKKPERRRKQTYEEKICSFCYDPCDERS